VQIVSYWDVVFSVEISSKPKTEKAYNCILEREDFSVWINAYMERRWQWPGLPEKKIIIETMMLVSLNMNGILQLCGIS
jgi:hypothetical protein